MKTSKRELPEYLSGTYQTLYALRSRRGAGLNHTSTGVITAGTIIEVTQIRYLSVSVWGRTKSGWICLFMSQTPYVVRRRKKKNENECEKTGT